MVRLTLFVFIITIYLVIAAHFGLAILHFNPLQSSGPSFSKNVFEQLKLISTNHFCIWSQQTETEELVNDLLISLTSNEKSVSSLRLTEEVEFREEFLHNVLLLENLTTCGNFWTTRRPITALHFVYVIVNAKWELEMEDESCLDVFGFARVVFVFLQDGSVVSLSPPQFPPRRFLEAQLDDLLSPVELIFHNLNGREVNVATFNCSPFVVFFGQDYDSAYIDGVEGYILKELSSLLNFKMNILDMSKDAYGAIDNGTATWGDSGLMGALKNYEADIGLCNIWCDLMNIAVLDFAPFNNLVSFTFLVPRPRLLYGSWRNLAGVFQRNVWVASLCCYFLCSFGYWVSCDVFATKNKVDPIESLLTVFGMLTLSSWYVRRAGRQVILWWLVFVLLMTATYSSGIAARLAKPTYEARIDSIQQLVDYKLHWYGNNINNGSKNFFINTANPLHREWADRYRFLPAHETVTSARSGQFAFLVQRLGSSMLALDIHGLDYDNDLEDMRILKEKTIDNIVTCFGFPKQAALSYTLQFALLQLRQMGLVDHWTKDAVRRLTPRYITDLQTEKDGSDTVVLTALSINNLTPAFYILLGGFCLGCIMFWLERFHGRYTEKTGNSNVYPFTPFVN